MAVNLFQNAKSRLLGACGDGCVELQLQPDVVIHRQQKELFWFLHIEGAEREVNRHQALGAVGTELDSCVPSQRHRFTMHRHVPCDLKHRFSLAWDGLRHSRRLTNHQLRQGEFLRLQRVGPQEFVPIVFVTLQGEQAHCDLRLAGHDRAGAVKHQRPANLPGLSDGIVGQIYSGELFSNPESGNGIPRQIHGYAASPTIQALIAVGTRRRRCRRGRFSDRGNRRVCGRDGGRPRGSRFRGSRRAYRSGGCSFWRNPVGTSDVGSSGAAGVDVAMGNGVGVASWAAPFVGSTSG